jgi:glycosyltransferase involved in cell wall biosynthesis
VLYVLPHADFFVVPLAGQVAHAAGVVEGLKAVVSGVCVLASPDARGVLGGDENALRFDTPVLPGPLWRLRLAWRMLRIAPRFRWVLVRSEPVFLALAALGMLLRAGGRTTTTYCVEVNGLGFTFARKGGGNPLLVATASLAYKLLLRPFHFSYAVNDDLRRRLGEGFCALPSQRLLVVHNGGPSPRYIAPTASHEAERPLHVFFFGVLNAYNDFPLVLEGLSAAKTRGTPTILHVVGDGRQRSYLQTNADGETVRVYGYMTRQAFRDMVHGTPGRKIGLLPMRYGNGSGSLSPLKAFEYLSLGLPLLYSNNCLQDILCDGVHGRTYEQGDSASFADSIVELAGTSRYVEYCANVRELYPNHTWRQRMATLMRALGNGDVTSVPRELLASQGG